jgi:hypothetical protein
MTENYVADLETVKRMAFRQPNPLSWEVSIEGLGTGLPLNVTTWAGTAMISRETFGTEAEAQARASVLRGRIYEAREAWSAERRTLGFQGYMRGESRGE